jgi:hypothetical protein
MNASASLGSADIERPLRDAISLLDQAVRLDPKFTLAYCESARAHILIYWLGPTLERRALGEAVINNALRLQPGLPEVRLAYAWHLYFGHDYRAREQLAIAKRGLANNADVFRLEAWIDARQGNSEKRFRSSTKRSRAVHVNPLSIHDLASTLLFSRQFRPINGGYIAVLTAAASQCD